MTTLVFFIIIKFSYCWRKFKVSSRFLNSKLAYWLIRHYGPCLGDKGFEFRKIFVEKLPIPQVSREKQEPIMELVNQIITVKKTDPKADTKDF